MGTTERCGDCGGPLAGWAGEHHSPQCRAGETRIEVLLETGTYEGGWKFAGEAEVPVDGREHEVAILAARTLWDEAYTGIGGGRRRLTFTTFGPEFPDGYVMRQEHRP